MSAARRLPSRDMMAEARAVRELAEMIKLPDDDEEGRQIIADGETELVEAVEAALDHTDDIAAMIEASKAKRAAMVEREKRLEERVEHVRLAVATALATAGLPRLPVAGELVVYVRPGPRLKVVDEAALPDRYIRVERKVVETRQVDRSALKRELEAGKAIPGAVMTNGAPTIQRRSK